VTFPNSQGDSTTLHLMIDSGSSTAAVCDYSYKASFVASDMETISCNLYGTGSSGYQGPFVNGSISLGGTAQYLPSSRYAFMKFEQQMPCAAGYDGIFGIAFKGMDSGYENAGFATAATSYDASANWCIQAQRDSQPAEYKAPLIQTLVEGTGTNSRLWGLYYSGTLGDDAGTLYLGADAKTNVHFTRSTPVVARMYNANHNGNEFGNDNWAFYNVLVTGFSVGSTSYRTASHSQTYAQGVIDTGTPILELPKDIIIALENSPYEHLLLNVYDANMDEVSINLGTGNELSRGGPNNTPLYSESQSTTQYILGWPVWLTQYTVMDIDNRQMVWVAKST